MKALLYLVAMFAMFPWVSFNLNSFDTQPFYSMSLIFMLIIYSIIRFKLPKKILIPVSLFMGIVFILVVYGLLQGASFSSVMRGGVSYLSLFLTGFFVYLVVKCRLKAYRLIALANLLYIFAGIVQIIFDPYVLDFAAPIRTTKDRGVTSFAAEPTYFALTLIMFSILHYILVGGKSKLFKFFAVMNMAAVILLAQSTTGILFVVLFLLLITISNLSLKSFLGVVTFIGVVAFALSNGYLDRVEKVSRLASTGLIYVVEKDASINDRVGNVVIPLSAFVSQHGVPHGIGPYKEQAIAEQGKFSGFFWRGHYEKIMSFIGAILFELGFFGLLILLAWIFKSIKVGWHPALVLFLPLLCLSAIPVANPLIAIIIWCMVFPPSRFDYSSTSSLRWQKSRLYI